MGSIAKHALLDYKYHDVGDGCATCTYTPLPTDLGRVVNANAYRSFVLTKAAHDLKDPSIAEAAEPNLRFVLRSQNADGSWFYAMDGRRDFIDHFHTCFVLKALVKIHALRPRDDCKRAIEAGLRYTAVTCSMSMVCPGRSRSRLGSLCTGASCTTTPSASTFSRSWQGNSLRLIRGSRRSFET